MAIDYRNVQFIKSSANPSGYPLIRDSRGKIYPEVAVAGRSNVGKSSLLNHLFGRKGIAKVSSTPGKTQLINFFNVDSRIIFADLPGYGFAKVPTEVRAQWGPMVQHYLENRAELKLVLFLFDIRREPNKDDHQFLDWAIHAQKAVILVFTKCDKVTKNQRASSTAQILKMLNARNLHYVHYSVPDNMGFKELTGMITEALADEETDGQD